MSFGPRCPNHAVPLTDCHGGVGICPISGARFSYDGNEAEKKKKLKLNSLGQYVEETDWDVQSLDGPGG